MYTSTPLHTQSQYTQFMKNQLFNSSTELIDSSFKAWQHDCNYIIYSKKEKNTFKENRKLIELYHIFDVHYYPQCVWYQDLVIFHSTNQVFWFFFEQNFEKQQKSSVSFIFMAHSLKNLTNYFIRYAK